MKQTYRFSCALGVLAALAPMAQASGTHAHGHGAGIGQAGEAAHVDREIAISMDEMQFTPGSLMVHAGETIRFLITNEGRAVHEFNLGTEEMWAEHRDEMREMMHAGMMTMRMINHDRMAEAGMMHDDPNSLLLAPGESGEIIWTFPEATEMGFACNIPGHFEAGMHGQVQFE